MTKIITIKSESKQPSLFFIFFIGQLLNSAIALLIFTFNKWKPLMLRTIMDYIISIFQKLGMFGLSITLKLSTSISPSSIFSRILRYFSSLFSNRIFE